MEAFLKYVSKIENTQKFVGGLLNTCWKLTCQEISSADAEEFIVSLTESLNYNEKLRSALIDSTQNFINQCARASSLETFFSNLGLNEDRKQILEDRVRRFRPTWQKELTGTHMPLNIVVGVDWRVDIPASSRSAGTDGNGVALVVINTQKKGTNERDEIQFAISSETLDNVCASLDEIQKRLGAIVGSG